MFTKLKHFQRAWAYESENTLQVQRAPEMTERVGLKLAGPAAARTPPGDGRGRSRRLRAGRQIARRGARAELAALNAAAAETRDEAGGPP